MVFHLAIHPKQQSVETTNLNVSKTINETMHKLCLQKITYFTGAYDCIEKCN